MRFITLNEETIRNDLKALNGKEAHHARNIIRFQTDVEKDLLEFLHDSEFVSSLLYLQKNAKHPHLKDFYDHILGNIVINIIEHYSFEPRRILILVNHYAHYLEKTKKREKTPKKHYNPF